ncbi:hypothetical protein FNF27_02059 [Cafeteria roenbergensis]|uniref:WW domain-containing protein n=1 Tax=Cafeteria roenbergensis TaxID=33653 RepID=A0A5A8EEP4_CAFRO|nr:hypothetical protein FNF27_02059 [Cafeteria roenbergensis]
MLARQVMRRAGVAAASAAQHASVSRTSAVRALLSTAPGSAEKKGSAAPELSLNGDAHKSPARKGATFRVPQDSRDWGGVERSQSAVEQYFTQVKKHRNEQMLAASEVEEGLLLYESNNRIRPIIGSLSFTVPFAAAAYCVYAKINGGMPLDSAPWLLSGVLAAAGAVARWRSRSASELTAHKIWLTNGGRDIRVQTFSHWFWGTGPLVRYPASAVEEFVPEGASEAGLRSRVRLLHLKGDSGPYLVMARSAKLPHPEVFEMLLRGDAGLTEQEVAEQAASQMAEEEEDQRMAELRASGSWEEAVDGQGRRYYWHTATRETRWVKPRTA